MYKHLGIGQAVLALAIVLGVAGWVVAQQSRHPPVEGREFTWKNGDVRFFIPEGVEKVRGILLVAAHEAGSNLYQDRAHRNWDPDRIVVVENRPQMGYATLAKRHGLAMMSFRNDHRRWDDVQAAMKHFATQSGRPEVAHAAFISTGLSAGAHYAQDLAEAAGPERCIANVPIAYCSNRGKAPGVPVLFQANKPIGRSCRASQAIDSARMLNERGGYAAVASHFRSGHSDIVSQSFSLFWLDQILTLRLPKDTEIPADATPKLVTLKHEDGWLGFATLSSDAEVRFQEPRIVAWSAYSGDRSEAFWFPNKETAEAWLEFCQRVSLRRFAPAAWIYGQEGEEEAAEE